MLDFTALVIGLAVIGYVAEVRADEHGRWQALENNPNCGASFNATRRNGSRLVRLHLIERRLE